MKGFERRRVYGMAGIALLMAGGLWLVYFFTSIAIKAIVNNEPLSGGWTLETLFLADLFSVLTIGYLLSMPAVQLLTKFTESGIEQPAFPRRQFISWSEIRRINGLHSSNIQIIGSRGKIVINPNMYSDSRRLISEIQARVPETALPASNELDREVLVQLRSAAGNAAFGSFVLAAVMFFVAKNSSVFVFGGLVIVYGLYEAWKWIQLSRKL